MTDAEIARLDKRMRERQAAEMAQCMANAEKRPSMTIEGAYNILGDPAITESSELPIAVKALITLALAKRHPDDLLDRIKFLEGQLGV